MSTRIVYNHWTGVVDCIDGLALKIIFVLSNETCLWSCVKFPTVYNAEASKDPISLSLHPAVVY